MSQPRVAVVGSGVAGLVSAWLLQRKYNVTIFEKNDYVGGHTHTVEIPSGPDAGTPVDTGFIVMNHQNYPLLTRLFERLDVPLRDSNMSFGYQDEESGLQYSGSGLNGVFAQRRNLLNPSFLQMVREILKFYKQTPLDLESGVMGSLSLGDYLKKKGFHDKFIHHHILPMGAAIWSTPSSRMLEFPAESFAHFFRNHGLLRVSERPQWRTVVGGSVSYVRKIEASLQEPVQTKTAVTSIQRKGGQAELIMENGQREVFDLVVVAAHADQAYRMLASPTALEEETLGKWVYNRHDVALHTDASVLPDNPRAQASWNYRRTKEQSEEKLLLSYDMNRLQGLETQKRCVVSLNGTSRIDPNSVIMDIVYEHPTYTFESMATQSRLSTLQEQRPVTFAGSYFGYGFHEDAVHSAVELGKQFDLEL